MHLINHAGGSKNNMFIKNMHLNENARCVGSKVAKLEVSPSWAKVQDCEQVFLLFPKCVICFPAGLSEGHLNPNSGLSCWQQSEDLKETAVLWFSTSELPTASGELVSLFLSG